MAFVAALRNKFEQLIQPAEKGKPFKLPTTPAPPPSKVSLKAAIPEPPPLPHTSIGAAALRQTSVPEGSYSHGLEAIYAIETVDIASIRPLQKKILSEQPAARQPAEAQIDAAEQQLHFDFGAYWSEQISSFTLLEPIDVLQLPARPLQLLKEHGKQLLGDLISMDLHSLVFIKGMGQGHIDEIRNKLAAYVKGQNLSASPYVGLASWVRSLIAGCCHKKSYALLSTYQLQHLVKLSPVETVELRNLSGEKRRCWENEAAEYLSKEASSRFSQQINSVASALIKPWVERRGGIASQQELVERFTMVSDSEENVLPVLALFSDVFCMGACPFSQSLVTLDSELFAANSWYADLFDLIIRRASSYFLRSETTYRLDSLCELVCREFASEWRECSVDLIAAVLRRSPAFLVRKHTDWGLMVRAA